MRDVPLRALFAHDPARFATLLAPARRPAGGLLQAAHHRRDDAAAGWSWPQVTGVEAAARPDVRRRGRSTPPRAGRCCTSRCDVPTGRRSLVDGHDVMPDVPRRARTCRAFSDGGARRAAGPAPPATAHHRRRQPRHRRLGPRARRWSPRRSRRTGARVRGCTSSRTSTARTSTRRCAALSPATTLFVVASKTFTTQETMANARSARAWLVAALGRGGRRPALRRACRPTPPRSRASASPPTTCSCFWDWVGGRYSLWSSIGLPIALAIGADRFDALLAGAHDDGRALPHRAAVGEPADAARPARHLEHQLPRRRTPTPCCPTTSRCAACRPTCSSSTWRATARA